MDPATSVDLRLSLRGYKAAFTRLGHKIDGFIKEAVSNNTVRNANDYSDKFKAQLEKLEMANDKLCATIPPPPDLEDLYKAVDEENEKFIAIHARLMHHIAFVEDTIREANGASVGASVSFDASSTANQNERGHFVDKSLQPFTLTKSHNPQELRQWCKAFIRYSESGTLARQTLSRQRGYFELCLDTDLQTDLESFIGPTTPVLGLEGCLQILEDRFHVFHLTFNCRVGFFGLSKEVWEDSSSLLTRVINVGSDANVGLLDKDAILTFVFLTADDDDEIRNEVSKQKTTNIDTVCTIVEQRMTNIRENSAVAGKVKSKAVEVIAAVTPAQHGRYNRPANSANSRQGQGQRKQHTRCPRCAGYGHASEVCFVLARGLSCHLCSKSGHISPACRSRPIGAAIGAIVLEVDDGHPEVTPRLPRYWIRSLRDIL